MSSSKEEHLKQEVTVTENETPSSDIKETSLDNTENTGQVSTVSPLPSPSQPPTPPTETAEVAAETTVTENEAIPIVTQTQDLSKLPENVGILKEAFPDIDVEIIEAILGAENNKLEPSFEILLGMSDPNYEQTSIPQQVTPPMPPRPTSQISAEPRSRSTSGNAPFAYWEHQQEPRTVEEQLRLDEEFAKKLALEDERRIESRRQQLYQQQQQQHQQQHYQKREQDNDQDSIFNLQEELPIIKEKMIEAGNAAKKKVLDFYNQIKANARNNNTPNQHEPGVSSSMPTTHAQYRGLPSDDGDDLLTGDISALHLSDYDVYAQTGGRQRNKDSSATTTTSTSNAQLKADEDFARQLANESSTTTAATSPMKKAVTPTVVIAPKSPLEFEGDSDYEDIGLTAAPSTNSKTEESNSVPYVIGDDDDSDSDDLVDIDDDELFDQDQDEKKTIEEPTKINNNNTAAATEKTATTATITTTTTKD
ncbi:hypothetical protein BDF21DRAFT_419616 [Thamnidium elegans]|nr:hypothetical protein BDF21DRAFT_419616 [Thamnidium elegans]